MKTKTLIAIFLWLIALGLLVPKLDGYAQLDTYGHDSGDIPFLLKALGEGESIVSAMSILQADLYFHAGAGHFFEEHAEGFAVGDVHQQDDVLNVPAEAHLHGNEGYIASPWNILMRVYDKLKVNKHEHLGDNEIKEIMPWLCYACEIDPHNVLGFTLTGHYLASKLGKVDEALFFLRKGLQYNPDSWEIYAEIGYIYFQQTKRYDAA
ncbi:MAG: hypothetical protein PHW46_04010 [Candidatus Omnitrophica bacterium]|nr:hypothetical protein [Candidatus Omnitrophota bacterium]